MNTNMTITIGKNSAFDCNNIPITITNNHQTLYTLIEKIATVLEATILTSSYHQFSPSGITYIAIISASHISIHSWPEHNYFGLDIFSCKPFNNEAIITCLKQFYPTGNYLYTIENRLAQITPGGVEIDSK